MSDAVDTIVLHSSSTMYAVRLLNKSDGTGESGVLKVDRSTLTGPDGKEPRGLDILRCSGIVFGANHVALNWDAATDDEALILSGSFYFDYTDFGPLKDPRSATNVGDLLLTTSGMVSGGGYCIDLVLQLRGA
jgi:hypothetical protein